jgi:type IV pilus assembly protein PilY1
MQKAFADILGGVLEDPVSFTAPVVSVNAFNSLELSDELYYSVFEPNTNLSWAGNLKRYRLGTEEIDKELVPAILDVNDKNAINADTTFFKKEAQSFWTPDEAGPDGEMVTRGGMANRLTTPRRILTSRAGSDALTGLNTVDANQLNITDKVASTPNYMTGLVAWANGFDTNKPEEDGSFATARKSMEDPLHSEPTIIKYSSSISESGVKSADRTLFIGTNSGFVHSFDVDENNPSEHFSFIPKELLQNLDKYYSGGSLYDHKAYGIDGPLTHWHQDSNGNGQVDDSEQVYLYITMRRGGQSLYALNVTDRSAPTLAWQKHGTYPADFPNKPAVSDDYANLGQTWARMEPATVMWDNEQKVVLFTAGGYDPVEDGTDMNGPSSRSAHTQGTTIYMIDAIDGSVLWDASEHANMPSDMAMTSSFASNVSPIDTSGDGLANMIYASDVGGRIWRFDINQPKIDASLEDSFESTKGDFANGAAIFDAYGGDGSGNRRFFNEVDVIYQKSKKGYDDSVLLSIGSGMRPHPLSTAVTNYHFVIKDELKAPETIDEYHTITFDQLSEYGATNLYGWYVPLTYPGEKVLARSNTYSDYILLSTFAPNEVSTTTVNCNADPGRTMLYILHNGITKSFGIEQGGIPPSPTIIEIPLGKDDDSKKNKRRKRNVIVGTEIVNEADEDTGKSKAMEVGNEFDNTSKDYWLEIARPEVKDIYEETTDE